jgi:cell division protein FtsB
MSGPSSRATERQQARRGGSTRTGRVSQAAAAVRERPSLTGRAVVLAGVLALLVFTLAMPMRELLHQRSDINALRAQNAATQASVDELTIRQQRLRDPAYVTSLVRDRLHYVLPGEVGYVVLDPSEAPAPTAARAAHDPSSWYADLWSSVQTADHAGTPTQAPAPIPVRSDAPR